MDDTPMILPPRPCRTIWFAAACVVKNAPWMLVLTCALSLEESRVKKSRNSLTPAFATKQSSPPNCFTVPWTNSEAVDFFWISPAMPWSFDPVILPASCSRLSKWRIEEASSMKLTVTEAPFLRNSRAMARPMPVTLPVMAAVLPASKAAMIWIEGRFFRLER